MSGMRHGKARILKERLTHYVESSHHKNRFLLYSLEPCRKCGALCYAKEAVSRTRTMEGSLLSLGLKPAPPLVFNRFPDDCENCAEDFS